MEELGKALAEAVRAGTALAPAALWGYYAVRVLEAIAVPCGFVGAISVIGYTARYGMNRWALVDEKRIDAKLPECQKSHVYD